MDSALPQQHCYRARFGFIRAHRRCVSAWHTSTKQLLKALLPLLLIFIVTGYTATVTIETALVIAF